MINQKFGKWMVLKESELKDKWGAKYYDCKCECGFIGRIRPDHLKQGKSRGCFACNKRRTSHGQSRTQTYKIWQGMLQRCYNQKTASYYLYGERKIKVCDSWHKFENFFNDMGERPEGTYLDRIDPDGNYDKDNCQWVTPQESIENRRISKKYSAKYKYLKKSNLCKDCLNKFINIIPRKD